MKPADIRSPWARLAFALLACMWAGAGWLVVLDGGFTTSTKHSRVLTRVEGGAGLLMACIFFVLAAIALAVLLQSLQARLRLQLACAAMVLVPPVVYLLRG